jgi:hypothetical protein
MVRGEGRDDAWVMRRACGCGERGIVISRCGCLLQIPGDSVPCIGEGD